MDFGKLQHSGKLQHKLIRVVCLVLIDTPMEPEAYGDTDAYVLFDATAQGKPVALDQCVQLTSACFNSRL